MKILHIITRSQWGGAQKVVYELAQRQQVAGHEVAVMCGEQGRLTRLLGERGITVKKNPYLKRAPGITDLFALYLIWREIRQGYDIVHAHSTKAGILVRALRVWLRFSVCFTVHGFGVTPEHASWQQRLYDLIERTLAAYTDGLIFVSRSDYLVAERNGWLKRAQRAVVIPNGIPTDRDVEPEEAVTGTANLRQVLGIPEDGFVIGNLARVAWVKNPELWLEAATIYLEENPKAYFVWYGEGPVLEHMRKKAAGLVQALRSRVIFAGEVENIDAALASMDVLFLSSRSEGMPLAVLEGMQKRRAILAPALPCLEEVLGPRSYRQAEDGSTPGYRPMVSGASTGGESTSGAEDAAAILYKPGDVEQSLQALRLLEDSVIRERLGKTGLARVEREYSAQRMAASYEKVYLEVIKNFVSQGRGA